MIELEKVSLSKKLEETTEVNTKLTARVTELTEENESVKVSNSEYHFCRQHELNLRLKQQFEEMVEEYENRIVDMDEDKKVRTKENVENLQTLIKVMMSVVLFIHLTDILGTHLY